MPRVPGRHFLQIPGPTNTPLRILAAIAQPTIDHRGTEFRDLARSVLARIRPVFGTRQPVIIYPASGTGAWEAALVNTLSAGDRILMAETGHFANQWNRMARRLGLDVDLLPGDWRSGADAARIEATLREDSERRIKAVAVIHNETSTGVTSDIAAVRQAIDRAGHPALLLVDTISSLGSIDYRHDEWGVDVTIGGSQKGLMLPPGLGFNAVSAKARAAGQAGGMPRSFWDWEEMLASNEKGFFPFTPSTNLLQGLAVALDMLEEEGMPAVFRRHLRAAEAVRSCVRHWGFDIQAVNRREVSPVLTAVRLPPGHSTDALRAAVLEQSSVSLGNGLGRLTDRVFRIGHLGDFNDPTLLGTLAAIEMGLATRGIPYRSGGVENALATLLGERLPAAAAL